ncbi:phthiocerol/phthiodiolone dimycocerosyl transferase family protein [Pimelobacter simplex]|uniref:phthiocerol/phthiodiolone dimycocerosyl transferase family protein n=1 Tax=Nocardioides simplex TaxID=2045 RepID=UPI00214F9EDA|nr:hypothetical protein [Pimelobacter simplex]UUW90055.1 hypothetical protein M0M43_00800 [Pimelobacter simplex]UUW93884.1 hypothetical protein M0M48_19310 [Pimelobacter simplex]
MGAHRPMTVAEKYYTFLDQAWPSTSMISADLDRCFDPDDVRRTWDAFRARRVLARSAATEDLTIADVGLDHDVFRSDELPVSAWDRVFEEEGDTACPLGVPLRCHYVTSPGEGRSRVIFNGHHSVIDGRIGITELQWFVRMLDGQDVPEQQQLSEPPAPATTHPWQQSRAAMIDLLREIKTRNAAFGPPGPADWPDATVPRRSWLRHVEMGPETSARIVADGRAHGANPFANVVSALLTSTAHVLAGGDTTLQLAAPADLGAPPSDPALAQAMAIAVLSRPFRVEVADRWALAAEVKAGIVEALGRGEGDLFFHLTRLDAVSELAVGRDRIAAALAAGPPCVVVSNMGVVDAGTDPEWLRSLHGQLVAAPNQVVFLALTFYKGRLMHTFATDDNRVAPEQREALVAEYLALVGAEEDSLRR